MERKSFLMVALFSIFMIGADVNAQNRLYIENFSIEAGETKVVPIILENQDPFTGFEAALYLPEGLTLDKSAINSERIQDNAPFYSTNENSGADGNSFIKLACMSFYQEAFKGNSGALVDLTITASETFSGTHEINLKDIVFTDADAQEFILDSDVATVTGPSSGEPESTEPDGIPLTLQMANSKGVVNMYVTEGSVQTFKFVADDGYVLHSVTFNGADVTGSINSYNVYQTPAITEASTLNVAFEVATEIEEVIASDRVKVTASNGVIRVNGTVSGENVGLYTSTGVQANFVVSNGDEIEFTATPGTVYIVKTANRTVKIAM